MMLSKEVFRFLEELRLNNNREWFNENKPQFQIYQRKIKLFFQALYEQLEKKDRLESVKIYRIYRDVRFSLDKTPYKHHFGGSFVRAKPALRGGYYLHLEPGNSFVGGGFWEPKSEDLLRIRKEFEMSDEEIRKILADKQFISYFKKIEGEELKTAPRGFDINNTAIDLIRKKQFVVSRPFTDKQVFQEDFIEEVIKTYQAMRPLFDYLSEVLSTNLNGESILDIK